MDTNPYEPPKTMTAAVEPQGVTYGRAIVVALVQQMFLLLLASLMLDGGRLLRALAGALAVSWTASLVLMLIRRDRPGPMEAIVVKYGFWAAIILLLLLEFHVGLPLIGI